MYNKSEIFYPKKLYLDLDFNKIKNNLKNIGLDYHDYGSIFMIKGMGFQLSVNNIGKIEIFFHNSESEQVKRSILDVENVFKLFVHDFKILH